MFYNKKLKKETHPESGPTWKAGHFNLPSLNHYEPGGPEPASPVQGGLDTEKRRIRQCRGLSKLKAFIQGTVFSPEITLFPVIVAMKMSFLL